MDNLEIVSEYMKEVASYAPKEQGQLLYDPQKQHFLIYTIHWDDDRRQYGCYLHIEVKEDGKVWIQHDGTDLAVADALVERGIPRDQIVLGFRSPFYRKMSDFAVA